MKKLLFVLLCFLSVNLDAQNPIDKIPFIDGKIEFDTIVPVKGKTADQLYSDTKLLISDLYRSGKAAIDVADKDGRFIVVKGMTTYPLKDFLGTINQKLNHTLTFQFKDGKMKITLTNLSDFDIPVECIIRETKGYRYSPKLREKHAAGVLSVWNELVADITHKLKSEKQDDW